MPNLKNTNSEYGWIAIGLHWSIALLIISLLIMGWFITSISYFDPNYLWLLSLHKSLGMLTLVLALFNAGWYTFSVKPQYPAKFKTFEILAAKAAHVCLLALMLLMPITGYLISTSVGDGIVVFNLLTVPALNPQGHSYQAINSNLHTWLGYGFAGIICLHVGAALKHGLVDKNGLLRRMLGIRA